MAWRPPSDQQIDDVRNEASGDVSFNGFHFFDEDPDEDDYEDFEEDPNPL